MSKDKNTSKADYSAGSADKIDTPSEGFSSMFLAVIFALVIAGWMLSGMFKAPLTKNKTTASTSTDAKQSNESAKLFHVEVTNFSAQKRQSQLILRGTTEFDARVQIKAEITGAVEAVPASKGKWVKKGDILCQIQNGERDSALLQAKARLAQAQADYEANKALARKGHTAQLRVSSFKAQLDAAKAELTRARLNVERTSIRAPFNGFVESLPTKVGDFLNVGTTCATLVSLHPLKVIGSLSEVEINKVSVGMKALVKLVTGLEKQGEIKFIASIADQQTRTFRIEVKVNNEDAKLREGLTADITIPLKLTKAHLFSPAILVLDDAGRVGLRVIDKDNTVAFKPVQILGDSPNGVWVSGLPETVKVITAGQEYVKHGQRVQVTEKKIAKSTSLEQGS